MIKSLRLAIPSDNPGGLEAPHSNHFGHCEIFTIVDISENNIGSVEKLANQEHGPGGCMTPVTMLLDQRVEAIVVTGIGARPLQGFNKVGISVYLANDDTVQSVQTIAEGMIAGNFPVIRPDQTCRNNGDCHTTK